MKYAPLPRRRLLVQLGSVGAGLSLAGLGGGCGDDESAGAGGGGEGGAPPYVESALFPHGVASGDPLADAVILWTRVTVEGGGAADVEWVVATDSELRDVVTSGTFATGPERDFTVKVDATGLAPATTYFYRFSVGEERSNVGRTRTAPSGPTDRLRIATVSCASYAHGYFHVYRAIAAEADIDLVLHLGDYIYEYASFDSPDPDANSYGMVRAYEPQHEILTLADYRARYGQYRRDDDLKEAHRQHPFVAIWDDHELANNAFHDGAENHDPATEGEWLARRAAAAQAYAEWMPIRDQGDPLKIWRSFSYGDLVELVLLDTRIWGRDEQAVDGDDPIVEDETRTLLGDDQEAWLGERLRTSTARWKLLAQQVMVGQLPQFLNVDQWDGYPAARTRLLDAIEAQGIGDVVVLTGDIHSSWAMDLARDPDSTDYDPATGAGSLAVEFVVPAVTSPGLGLDVGDALETENPWMKFVDTNRRGFVVLDITADRVQAAYTLFDQIEDPVDATPSFAAAMATYIGTAHLVDDGAAAAPRDGAPELAP